MRRHCSPAITPDPAAYVGGRRVTDEAIINWPTCHDADVELDARTAGSVQVRLLWRSSSGRTWVEVTPLGEGERFHVEAAPSLARAVFWHPYAYRNRPMAHADGAHLTADR